ncbi:hypothetical protein P3L10_026240 [Capsicum annuum]|uniref:uncharacterized protein LOC107842713 n=1 Tax=Capsicum annuum TaxID=4072 RepID=UPI001FB10E73|nr:uncharacterized protein LOC107842713 [Capsicum annuum]
MRGSSVVLPLLWPTPPIHRWCARSRLSGFEFFSKLPSISFPSTHDFPKRSRTSTTLGGINSNDPNESAFFNENGVVEDMDSYLNHLSLEYDSVWDTKPSWCQPWTITLTGTLIISLSWLVLHSALATAVVMTIIGAWWYIFLYSYPKAYSDMIAERRKECDKQSRRYVWREEKLVMQGTPLGQQYYVRWSRAYSDMIDERRKRVTNGQEDTYGARKSQ